MQKSSQWTARQNSLKQNFTRNKLSYAKLRKSKLILVRRMSSKETAVAVLLHEKNTPKQVYRTYQPNRHEIFSSKNTRSILVTRESPHMIS